MQGPDERLAEAVELPSIHSGQVVVPEQVPPGFEFIEMISSEGNNLVYKARNQALDQFVAIKILRADAGASERTAEIMEEARLIANLNHRSIVKLFQVGTLSNGASYLVYEFLQGRTLRTLLNSGRLDIDRVGVIFQQLLDGLSYMHTAQLLHRDIKPENIMVDEKDSVKILDFGIARQFDEETGEYRTAGLDSAVKGTPFYMSPEQCERKALSAASDIYSAGCVLYECIVGNPPFRGETAMETIYKHTKESVPELPDLRAGKIFQDRIQQLIQQVLAKNPFDRPDAKVFSEHLHQAISARSGVDKTGKPTKEESAFPLWIAIGTAAGAVIILVFGVIAWLEHSQKTSRLINDYNLASADSKIHERRLALSTPKSVKARIIRIATDYTTWSRTGHAIRAAEVAHFTDELDSLLSESKRGEDLYAIQIWYGRVLRTASRFDEAIEHFRAALEFCKDKGGKKCLQAAQCYLQIGDNLLMKGDYKLAIENLKRAEKIHREFDEDEERFYLLDIPEVYRALEVRGFMVRIQDNLGAAYYLLKDWKNARRHLELARALWTKDDEPVQFVEGKERLLEVIYQLEGRAGAIRYIREWEAATNDYARTFTHVRNRYNNLYYVQKAIALWCEQHPDMLDEAAAAKERMKDTTQEREFDSSLIYKNPTLLQRGSR